MHRLRIPTIGHLRKPKLGWLKFRKGSMEITSKKMPRPPLGFFINSLPDLITAFEPLLGNRGDQGKPEGPVWCTVRFDYVGIRLN